MPRKVPLADLKERFLAELGKLALDKARGKVESKTLRDALRIELRPDIFGVSVGAPHYWAIYYHDGRGPVRAAPGKWLVYFKDPADDPRIKRGYPVRAADIIRLSRSQFLEALAKDQLIVTKSVGRAKAHPFFTRGMQGMDQRAHAPAKRFVREMLGDFIGRVEKDSLNIRLK